MVRNTGCKSFGEREITRRISLVAACCSNASFRRCSSSRSSESSAFRDFLAKLHSTSEGAGSLLDQTMVLLGSNLGNASSHSNENLPILLAGGGFKHGQHLPFSQTKNAPLANLFVTMLQRLGDETDRFASSTGTINGMDMT